MLSLLLYQVLIFCEKKLGNIVYCILYCKEEEVIRVESRPVTADRRFNTYWAKVAHHSVLIYCPFFATEACYELPKHPKKFMKNRTQNTDSTRTSTFHPFPFPFPSLLSIVFLYTTSKVHRSTTRTSHCSIIIVFNIFYFKISLIQ